MSNGSFSFYVRGGIFMNEMMIQKAEFGDLPDILKLQYLAYQSEADLFGTRDIPPLKQTLEEVVAEYEQGVILKILDKEKIIGSVRVKQDNDSVYIGKLMVHPEYRRRGLGKRLLLEIEKIYPNKRYELFTSTISLSNIRLYEGVGYKTFHTKKINDKLSFVYLEK